jgi:hypothetical protein
MIQFWGGCLAVLFASATIYAQLKNDSCNEYRGTLGTTTQIGLSLYAKEQRPQGSYFYKKNLQDSLLTGKYTASREAEVLRGNWVSADAKTTYPVYLRLDQKCMPPGQSRHAIARPTSDEVVEKNAKAFFDAVVVVNRSIAAKCVPYPATFFDNGKQQEIIGSSDFLKVL